MDTSRVTRFEVINHAGPEAVMIHFTPGGPRAVIAYGIRVELSLQDQGRTLKVFLTADGGEV